MSEFFAALIRFIIDNWTLILFVCSLMMLIVFAWMQRPIKTAASFAGLIVSFAGMTA